MTTKVVSAGNTLEIGNEVETAVVEAVVVAAAEEEGMVSVAPTAMPRGAGQQEAAPAASVGHERGQVVEVWGTLGAEVTSVVTAAATWYPRATMARR
jgi:hypothetical protein